MAVPKKRTSKMKSRSRRSVWMNKGNIQAQRALSLAKSLATNNNTTFVYSSSNSEIVED
jgi:large subunit ribosomal protein L32|tara:strand:+ start:2625 stop:2801 length:177 start_codon:yes stop_codon:yes gene_type:complete